MPYRIHPSDRKEKVLRLASFLETTPAEDIPELLKDAETLLNNREFGNAGMFRDYNRENPYWYENNLIQNIKKYLASGSPIEAFMYCLQEHNHGHSGFVKQTCRVYMHPLNDKEREVSEEIHKVIIQVAEALVESNPLSKSMSLFGDGWTTIVYAWECLKLLGESVPPELVEHVRILLIKCEPFKKTNEDIAPLEIQFQARFG